MDHGQMENLPFCRSITLDSPGTKAFVVIDSFLGGGGTGGIRMGEGVSQQEVTDLAHEMRLKFAWLNIPRGGAKEGICIDEALGEDDIARLLAEFGNEISDLLQSGKYVAGLDLGVGPAELQQIMAGAGIKAIAPAGDVAIDSNYFTALTVYSALEALLAASGRNVGDSTFLLEGAGKVGGQLMAMLDEAGGRIVGVSTIRGMLINPHGIDVQELLDARDHCGDACVSRCSGEFSASPEELYWQAADVLIPGARTRSIRRKHIGRVKARFIVPVANAVASVDAEQALHDAGIRYLPGFVTNSGGIFAGTWRGWMSGQ